MGFLHTSVLFICIIGSTICAGDHRDDIIWRGVNAFYNYQTASAISILDSARLEYPDNPLTHFTWAAAHMLHSEAYNAIDDTYLILNKHLDEIIPILKQLQKKFPEDPIYNLYLGCAIGLRARVNLGKKQWLKTLVNSYKGLRIILYTARNNPELIDAQLPIGIIEYYTSLNSGPIRWGAGLMGIDANRDAGLAKIKRAAVQGNFSSIEAKFIFSFLSLWIEENPHAAISYSRELRKMFPKNYHYGIMYVECLILIGKNIEAQSLLEILEKELSFLTPIQQGWYHSYYLYELALFQFLNNSFEKSLINVNAAINNYGAELDIVLGNAWLLRGMIHDKNNNRDEAKRAYHACMSLDNRSAAMKRAKQFYELKYK